VSGDGSGRLVVRVRTRGGLAAGVARRRPDRVVDSGMLAAGDAVRLRALVDRARADAALVDAALARWPDGSSGSAGSADALRYTVTVDRGDGGPLEELRASDATIGDALADLVDWVEAHAPVPDAVPPGGGAPPSG